MGSMDYHVTFRVHPKDKEGRRKTQRAMGKYVLFPRDVCTERFLARATRFRSYGELKRAAGLPDAEDDQSAWIPAHLERKWDNFIARTTKFADTQELLDAAVRQWALDRLHGDAAVLSRDSTDTRGADQLTTNAATDDEGGVEPEAPAEPEPLEPVAEELIEDGLEEGNEDEGEWEEGGGFEITPLEEFSGTLETIDLRSIPARHWVWPFCWV